MLVLMLALLLIVGCYRTGYIPNELSNTIPQNENGNFILYVSNFSKAIDPVDINVEIDGECFVNGLFPVDPGGPVVQPRKFQFLLPDGMHIVKVKSVKGKEVIEQQIEIKGNHWAIIDYVGPEATGKGGKPLLENLFFRIQDKPILFL